MDIIAFHGDRKGIYTFDKRRIRKRADGIVGWYFVTEDRESVCRLYDDNYRKYVLHINNPIYEERPSKMVSVEDCKGHDCLIALSDDDWVNSFSKKGIVKKGEIIEICVFDKSIIEEIQ